MLNLKDSISLIPNFISDILNKEININIGTNRKGDHVNIVQTIYDYYYTFISVYDFINSIRKRPCPTNYIPYYSQPYYFDEDVYNEYLQQYAGYLQYPEAEISD